MGKADRKGARKNRNNRKRYRIPELGYYLIVTDTKETEKNYFEGIRNLIPIKLRDRLVIKVEHASTVDLVNRAIELRDEDPQYRIPWIVFDRDQVRDFNAIIKTAERADVQVGWSNPCIEIWFFAYLGEIPNIDNSVSCCTKFEQKYERKTGQKYSKADNDIYEKLNHYGNEEKAIIRAERRLNQLTEEGKRTPSEMYSGNTVFQLIKELNVKKAKK